MSVPPAQPGALPRLNWSHFKPEFAGWADEDAEAHLPRINDWMNSYAPQKDVKVQMFCLTLVDEARFVV